MDLLLRFESHRPGGVIERAILENVVELEELLRSSGYDCEVAPRHENRSGILGIRWPEADEGGEPVYVQARKFLLNRRIVISVRGGRLRVSTHAYNNSQDHQQLVEALNDFRRQEC